MMFPDFYYYQSTDDSVIYTHLPQRRMNIPRLIKGQAYWERSGAKVSEKKTLILTAWALVNLFEGGHTISDKGATRRIQKWLRAGFTMYCWQAGDIIQVTEDFLLPIEFWRRCRLITPAQPDHILQIVKQKLGGWDEQYLLVDNNLMRNPMILQPNIIFSDDWNSVTEHRNEKVMVTFLRVMADRLRVSPESLIHDEFTERQRLHIDCGEGEQLPFSFQDTKKKLFASHCVTVELANTRTFPPRKEILELMNGWESSQCEKLELSRFIIENKWLKIPNTLRELIITESALNISDLNNFLKNCQIQSLEINTCAIESDSLLMLPQSLESLKVSNEQEMSNDATSWISLQGADKLVKLEVEYIEDLHFEKHDLPVSISVKYLIIAHNYFTWNMVAKLFPNLKELDLSLHIAMETTPEILPRLTHMILRDYKADVPVYRLEKIMRASPKLNYLLLEDYDRSRGEEINLESIPTGLEHLALCNSNVDFTTLPRFSNLKILELNSTQDMTPSQEIELKAFVRNCKDLVILDCSGMQNSELALDLIESVPSQCVIIPSVQDEDYSPYTIIQQENEDSDFSDSDTPSYSSVASDQGDVSPTFFVDANTAPNNNHKFNLEQIFHPVNSEDVTPAPTEYRMQIFNRLILNPEPCEIDRAFILKNTGVDGWKSCSASRYQGDSLLDFIRCQSNPKLGSHYYSKIPITASPEWQALPSYKPHEVMTYYQIIPNSAVVKLRYKTSENRYYILSEGHEKIELAFIIKVPSLPKLQLPLPIAQKIDEIKKYSKSELENLPPQATGSEYYQALTEQRRGACRHRVIALMGMVQNEIPVRYVQNHAHAKVEMYVGDVWHSLDLGGYPAQIKLLESNVKEEKSNKTSDPFVRHYSQKLQTWTKEIPSKKSTWDYLCGLLFPADNQRLILTKNKQHVSVLRFAIQTHLARHYRLFSYFVVQSYDDLICSAPTIAHDGFSGHLVPGPGGPLYHFIKKEGCADFPQFLLVDLSHFSTEELLQFKTAFASKPKIDGIDFPNRITLIAIATVDQESSINEYEIKSEHCELECQVLAETQVPLPFKETKSTDSISVCTINLFNSPDWHSKLLGRWLLSQNQLIYEEGELILALQTGAAIEIQNGLWNNSKFIDFWREAFLLGGVRRLQEQWTFPADQLWYKRDGYDWDKLLTCMSGCYAMPVNKKAVLNPEQINLFLGTYACNDEQHSLEHKIGLIQQQANATVEVHLTAPLKLDQWAILLTDCLRYHVQLFVYCRDKLLMPELFQAKMQTNLPSSIAVLPNHTQIIISNNCDVTTALIEKKVPGIKTIDISDCDNTDLLASIDGKLANDGLSFIFSNKKSSILTLLEQGDSVLLTGLFSQELIDSLASIVIDRIHSETAPGQFIIVTDQADEFAFIAYQKHEVSPEIQRSLLVDRFGSELVSQLTEQQLQNGSLAVLTTRLRYLQAFPGCDSDMAWKGFAEIKSTSLQTTYDLTQSNLITQAVNQQRLNAVSQTHQFMRFAYLLGLTGVGKTTFIDCILGLNAKIYYGESSLRPFARDQAKHKKYLFIDEANLVKLKWSLFEGLFNNPPALFLDGEYSVLDEWHFIIFAANPQSYGAGRVMAHFFKRHGGAVLFDPLPPEYLYETILKPIFMNTIIEQYAQTVSVEFLNIYTYMLQLSVEEVLITPREIQMMALLTLAHCMRTQMTADPMFIAKHYGHFVAKELVPEKHRAEFDAKFAVTLSTVTNNQISSRAFLPTVSRIPALILLADLFVLRTIRQNYQCNDAQRYGGLGGVLFEGGPASGKNSLIEYALAMQDYVEHRDYLRLNQSPFIDVKRQQLNTGFNEGRIILLNDLNATLPMERDLNAYLMGKTLNNERPATPGSFGLFLQYPVSCHGRKKLSSALSRRLLKVVLPDYPQEELALILAHHTFNPKIIDPLLIAFILQCSVAKELRLSPAPNLKHVLSLEKQVPYLEDDEMTSAKVRRF